MYDRCLCTGHRYLMLLSTSQTVLLLRSWRKIGNTYRRMSQVLFNRNLGSDMWLLYGYTACYAPICTGSGTLRPAPYTVHVICPWRHINAESLSQSLDTLIWQHHLRFDPDKRATPTIALRARNCYRRPILALTGYSTWSGSFCCAFEPLQEAPQ